ncbi:MAG: tetratricopeptide repeat protein [Thermodesulfovibrionales bacterium]|nr:tetratricopeptide repeat protein [Thermodesulfovibrionales bacterium]
MCLPVLFSCGLSKERAGRAEAHYKMGASYLSENKLQPAYVEFQKGIEIAPGNKEYHNALGIVHMRFTDYRKAEESFSKAIRIDKDYSEGYNNLCFLYYTEREWQKAVENCKKALNNPLYQTPEKAFYNLGKAYYRLRMYDDAVRVYWEALRRSPGLYIAYYEIALAHNAKGEYGNASAALSKGIEFDPRFNGSRAVAESEFRSGKVKMDDPIDLKDMLDMFNY